MTTYTKTGNNKCCDCRRDRHVNPDTGHKYFRCIYHLHKQAQWQKDYAKRHKNRISVKKKKEMIVMKKENRCVHCFNIKINDEALCPDCLQKQVDRKH